MRGHRHKPLFAATEAINYVTKMVIAIPAAVLPAELAGIAVNVSLDGTAADVMLRGDALKQLVARVTKTRDPMVMKVVRNLSQRTLALQSDAADAADEADAQAADGKDDDNDDDHDDDNGKPGAGGGASRQQRARSNSSGRGTDATRRLRYTYAFAGVWAPVVRDIVRLLSIDSAAMHVEVLGTLANLTPMDFPDHVGWHDILRMPGA